MGGWFHPPKPEKTRPFPVERFSSIFLRDMCINSYHSPMTKRIFQMNSRKYQNTGGKVEVLPPPHSDPLYNEVSISFLTNFFRKCQFILGILINFCSLSVKPHGKLVFTHHYIKKHILPIFPPAFPPIFSL